MRRSVWGARRRRRAEARHGGRQVRICWLAGAAGLDSALRVWTAAGVPRAGVQVLVFGAGTTEGVYVAGAGRLSLAAEWPGRAHFVISRGECRPRDADHGEHEAARRVNLREPAVLLVRDRLESRSVLRGVWLQLPR